METHKIKFDTFGRINNINSQYNNWYLKIINDEVNTGGYFIYYLKSVENTNSLGYDEWYQNSDNLNNALESIIDTIIWLD